MQRWGAMVMVYGSETWVMMMEEEGVLQQAERFTVRIMYREE